MTPSVGDYVKHKKPSGSGHYRGILVELLPPSASNPRHVRAKIEWLGKRGSTHFGRSRHPVTMSVVHLDNLELLEPGKIRDEDRWPEHDKQQQVSWLSQYVGDFLDWLTNERQLHICRLVNTNEGNPRWEHWEYVDEPMTLRRINELLGEYFGVDQKVIDAEKDEMLRMIRETTNSKGET
jgi:hypothetical protein